MDDTNLTSIEQISSFLASAKNCTFSFENKVEKKKWIQNVLLKLHYRRLLKKDKGCVRRYIKKITGYSKTQSDRLIQKHFKGTLLQPSYHTCHSFKKTYIDSDILLLAQTDKVHKRPCGQSLKEIFRREYHIFHHADYKRLSHISVSHIYNLRKTFIYKNNTTFFDVTRPSSSNIGQRKKPYPDGKPGYIRIDSVHQGDLDGEKGVYHINTVDEVAQWEIVICVPAITWEYMKPAFESIIRQYPFMILAFHADNGSEYINHQVADMLNQLNVQLTKSRARRSNDNALVESKNGSVIRKHMGYAHIPKINYYRINQFHEECFNIYLNFHRPCLFATITVDAKGKQKKKYKECMTPYEKFKSLDNPEQYLKEGITIEYLDSIAYAVSDNEFAEVMMKEKQELFEHFIFPS
jgi:hypothetical protein